jgi:hypothetical protein
MLGENSSRQDKVVERDHWHTNQDKAWFIPHQITLT